MTRRPTSAFGKRNRRRPRITNRTGSRTKKEKVVRVCDKISGSIGRKASPLGSNRPVKAARPKVAATPQRKVAAAM
jgi:hypothetical protein